MIFCYSFYIGFIYRAFTELVNTPKLREFSTYKPYITNKVNSSILFLFSCFVIVENLIIGVICENKKASQKGRNDYQV